MTDVEVDAKGVAAGRGYDIVPRRAWLTAWWSGLKQRLEARMPDDEPSISGEPTGRRGEAGVPRRPA